SGDIHWSWQKTDRHCLSRHAIDEDRRGPLLKRLQRDVHGLETGLAFPNQRTKRNKTNVLVKPHLARRSGNQSEVIALTSTMISHDAKEPAKYLSVSMFFLNRQETDLTNSPSSRQIGIEVLEFLVE